MPKKKRRAVRKTVLIAGEGRTDAAFLKHMKGLFCTRGNGQCVTVHPGNGGSPHQVVSDVIKGSNHMDYDYRYVLLDEDVEIESKTFKYASENNVTIIVSAPTCLEGMLLNVLGERSPTDNARCKRALERSLSGPRTESCSYGCLDKNILSESGHETIDRLISLLEGNH